MSRRRHTPEQIITALREAEVGLANGKVDAPRVRRLKGLVEHEHGDWFGLGGIEGRSLVEEEVPLRRVFRLRTCRCT